VLRVPLQYIIGSVGFYNEEYEVSDACLIPRQDTETVIECCLDFLKQKENPEVLDLCAGSGCIGITLACEKKDSLVVLLEKYAGATRYTKENISALAPDNATLVMGDVLQGDFNDRKYDLIVSNPPYVTADEMKALQPELSHEPETALLGGEDGLDFYRAIAKNYKSALKDNGRLVFEIGSTQAQAVAKILEENGFKDIEIKKDLAELDRVVFGTLNTLE
jgi:release factor glutamine methyltransferase